MKSVKIIKTINKCLINLPWVILCVLFGFMIYYNYTLQNQVYERDKIIQQLAFSDSLVHKYFEIKLDTLNNYNTYTLKEEFRTKEIHHNTTQTITERYTEYIEDTTKINSQKNTITILTNKYKTLVESYNGFVGKYNEVNDSLQMLKMAFSLVKRNFDISYNGTIENQKIKVSLDCEKADSAFLIFPYYKDKLRFNSEKNIWEIKK